MEQAALAQSYAIPKRVGVSTLTFFMFQIYQLDFFLRISVRIDGIAVARPTLMLFAIVTLLLVFQREQLKERLRHPVVRALGWFLLIIVITLPLVRFPGSVVRFHVPDFTKAIVFLYFTALILDSERRLKWGLLVFVFCQVVRVLEPLYLNITQGYWGSSTFIDHGEFANRLSGAPVDVINANELGFVIVTIIPYLHYLLFSRGWLCKLLYLGLMPLLLYALILTMSRGAFLALLVVGWVVWKESNYKLLLMVMVFAVALAGWSVMDSYQRDRYLSIFSSDAAQAASATGRVEGIKGEFRIALKRPIFGHGLGTTPEAKVHAGHRRQASHNMYAEVLIELGIVGAIFFFLFIKRIYQQIRRSSRDINTGKGRDFHGNLLKAYKVIFWMFALYSLNYWGLSQYYWYNLAGLVVAASMLTKTNLSTGKKLR
jgi:putative inorganic carbon (hco3(-)) transporter